VGHPVDVEREGLARALGQTLADCRFAFVFGSFFTRSFNDGSDIDIAVDFGRALSLDDRLSLSERLDAATGRHVDVVDLRRADPIIAMQVLKRGRLLVAYDRLALAVFQMKTISEYLDWKIDRAPVEVALLSRRVS
jgi:predicted nucleotidyltransferase